MFPSIVIALGFLLAALPLHGQWIPTNGPWVGGDIPAFASFGDRLYAASDLVVYVSTDHGARWSHLTSDHFYRTEFATLLVMPDSTYASGHTLFAGHTRGLFRTSDAGNTWWESDDRMGGLSVQALAQAGSRLYAGTFQKGLFYSDDSGARWNPMDIGIPTPSIRSILCMPDADHAGAQRLYVGVYGAGVFTSSDSGRTWTQVNTGLENTVVHALAGHDSTLYAATLKGLFRSTDRGQRWLRADSGLTYPYLLSLLVVPSRNPCGLPTVFAGSNGGGVFRTTDAGAHWASANRWITNGAIPAIGRIDSFLIAGTKDGVFVSSDNGELWIPSNTGMKKPSVTCIASEGDVMLAGSDRGIFLSTDEGDTWNPIKPGLVAGAELCITLLMDSGRIFAGTNFGAFVSADRGFNWPAIMNGLPTGSAMLGKNGTLLFAGTRDGIFRSFDYGLNWTLVFSDELSPVFAFDSGNIYAMQFGASVWRSRDGGVHWTDIGCGFPMAIAAQSGTLWLGVYGGILRSTDAGASWEDVSSGIPRDAEFKAMAPADPLVFASNTAKNPNAGLYMTRDNGAQWELVSAGLPAGDVYALATKGRKVYAGIDLQGVWKRSLDDFLDGVEQALPVPLEAQLHQNYPNPCPVATTIAYTISGPGKTTLRIIDMLGRTVFTLSETHGSGGRCQNRIDTSHLPAGMYRYVLDVGGQRLSRVMAIVR